MESKIKIMCTSTGCLDYAPERYRGYDIDIIRILVNFKGKEYKEGYDLDPVDVAKKGQHISIAMPQKVRRNDKLFLVVENA